MTNPVTLTVNGEQHTVHAAPETPLLYVLRNDLGLNGPQYGCGQEQCGSCKVLLGARAVHTCHLPLSEVGQAPITTLEGLSEDGELHPVQQAFIEMQAMQCGYCINGMIIETAALLVQHHHPSDEQIRAALDNNLCRCGSHLRIIRAVKRAADLLWGAEEKNV
jgi:nicotinate dehydrogenase subunit A